MVIVWDLERQFFSVWSQARCDFFFLVFILFTSLFLGYVVLHFMPTAPRPEACGLGGLGGG